MIRAIIILILFNDIILACIGYYGLYKLKARFKNDERLLSILESKVNAMYENPKRRIVKVKRQTIYFKEKK